MNENLIEFLSKILNSDLPKDTRTKIIEFYTLPRIVAVKSKIEIENLEEPDEEVGAVSRPSPSTVKKRENPVQAEGTDAVKETLDAGEERDKIKG